MKVIIPMNMKDVFALLYLQRSVFTSHTKMLLQKSTFEKKQKKNIK